MPVFHYLHLRTFAHGTEDPEKVRRAMAVIASDEKLSPAETPVEGSHGNRIVILEIEVRSAKAERALFANLSRDDPAGFAKLEHELERRLDENLNFHVLLDKQEASLGRIVLATDDDAVTVRAKVRSFGKSSDSQARAREDVRTLLGRSRSPGIATD